MRNDEREHLSPTAASPAVPVPWPPTRCQVCGASHEATQSILCATCGEPVLLCGWAGRKPKRTQRGRRQP
jgi:hypothetical protein